MKNFVKLVIATLLVFNTAWAQNLGDPSSSSEFLVNFRTDVGALLDKGASLTVQDHQGLMDKTQKVMGRLQDKEQLQYIDALIKELDEAGSDSVRSSNSKRGNIALPLVIVTLVVTFYAYAMMAKKTMIVSALAAPLEIYFLVKNGEMAADKIRERVTFLKSSLLQVKQALIYKIQSEELAAEDAH